MPRDAQAGPQLSIVVPLFNEAGTVQELHRRLTAVLFLIGRDAEIVYVDDGSSEVHGQRERVAETVRVRLDCVQQGGGRDTTEWTDHVGPLGVGLAASPGVIDGHEAYGPVERVRLEHVYVLDHRGAAG